MGLLIIPNYDSWIGPNGSDKEGDVGLVALFMVSPDGHWAMELLCLSPEPPPHCDPAKNDQYICIDIASLWSIKGIYIMFSLYIYSQEHILT